MRAERTALRAQADARTAQLDMLTQQLQPHFLFNALTSLRGLIHSDPERAEVVLDRLAAFLRRTLARPAGGLGPLADELAHAQAYLEIERSRHDGGIEVAVAAEPEAAEAMIPTFLMHPLVENAVKHGRAGPGQPRGVDIRASLRDAILRVEVTSPGRLATDEPAGPFGNGAGIGLRNVRRRLEHFAPGRHAFRLEEGDGRVRAVLEVDQAALRRVDSPATAAATSAGVDHA